MSNHSVIASLAAAFLLGGCAGYAPSPRSYSYFSVPCDTPGAIRAEPIAPQDVLNQPAAPPIDGPPAPPSDASAAPACLLALVRPGHYASGYYIPAYPYGYYGAPLYGSLGSSFGLGGHHYPGHFSGSHFGGAHTGSGHSGGHSGFHH